jgi:hypothetical protein
MVLLDGTDAEGIVYVDQDESSVYGRAVERSRLPKGTSLRPFPNTSQMDEACRDGIFKRKRNYKLKAFGFGLINFFQGHMTGRWGVAPCVGGFWINPFLPPSSNLYWSPQDV